MEALPQLQARMDSLRELGDLIRALRALAATHVQEAQGALPGIRRYVEVIEDAIAEGATLDSDPDGPSFRGDRRVGEAVLIAVCSEHGFAGAFNERLLDAAQANRAPGQKMVVIGRRGEILAEERGLNIAWSVPMATHVGGVLSVTRSVADHLAAVSEASIVFGRYERGGGFEPEVRRILPLDPELLAGSERRAPPLHQLPPAVLLEKLAGEYLFAEITRAVVESLASENGARLRVMESADHNLGEKLEGLQRRERHLRQEATTSELLDLVVGSEAILGDGKH